MNILSLITFEIENILMIRNIFMGKLTFFLNYRKFARAAQAPRVCVFHPNKRVMSGKFADVCCAFDHGY